MHDERETSILQLSVVNQSSAKKASTSFAERLAPGLLPRHSAPEGCIFNSQLTLPSPNRSSYSLRTADDAPPSPFLFCSMCALARASSLMR